MPLQRLDTLVRFLLRRAGTRGDDPPDGALLEQFLRTRDEAAFTALVERHGPMVYGVCRRALHHAQDAEDAFQATFLILARRAADLRRTDSVVGWLHTVATRLALRARADAARRPVADGGNLDMRAAEPDTTSLWHDLRPVLDEELQRLPEKYRVPVILCYLEGCTHADAARRLGWPKGTVAGRLARARELLRDRLTRRGVTLSSALLGSLLADHASAALPAGLANAAVRGALTFAVSSTTGISTQVLALAEEGLQAMFAAKVKVGAMLTVTLTFALAGAGVWAHQTLREKPEEPSASAEPQPTQEEKPQVRMDRYGDPLPEGAVARLGTVRWRLAGEGTLRFSSDGKLLAAAQRSHGISVLDARTGIRLHTFPGHGVMFEPLGFSPDGSRLFTVDFLGKFQVWNVSTGKGVIEYRLDFGPTAAYLSPDAKLLAYPTKQEIQLLDADTTAVVRTLEYHKGGVALRFASFSPDGRFFAAPSVTVRDKEHFHEPLLWDVTTGKKVRRFGELVGALPGLAFSPDSRLLAGAGGKSPVVIWDVNTGKELRRLPEHSRGHNQLAITSDGKLLLSASKESQIHVWDIATGRELRRFGEPSARMVLAPDGRVATTRLNEVRLWDHATGKEIEVFDGHPDGVWTATFSDDGKTVVAGDRSGQLRTWDVRTGRTLRKQQVGTSWRMGLSPGGRIVSGIWGQERNVLSLRDLATDRELPRITFPDFGPEHFVRAPGFSPDNTTVLATYAKSPPSTSEAIGHLGLWETATGKELWHHTRIQMGLGLACSRDGRFFAFRNANRGPYTFHIWDVGTGQEVNRFPGSGESADGWANLALSPNGRLLASACRNHPLAPAGDGAYYSHLGLWEAASGQEIGVMGGQHGWIDAVLFSPDGRLLASAHREGLTTGSEEFCVRLWDVATRGQRVCLRGHAGIIHALAFSNDGRYLVSASQDTTLLVWDLARLLPPKPRPAPPSAKEVEAAWADLARDAKAAHGAIHTLASAPGLAMPLLKERLKPAPAIPAGQLAQWVRELDDARFEVRERARGKLEKAELAAEQHLAKALAGKPSAEVRQQVEALQKKLRGPVTRADLLRDLRAVEVLERIGTAEACDVLKKLAEGTAEARLTQEAKKSLRLLTK